MFGSSNSISAYIAKRTSILKAFKILLFIKYCNTIEANKLELNLAVNLNLGIEIGFLIGHNYKDTYTKIGGIKNSILSKIWSFPSKSEMPQQ